ncbi:FecCD family ABC transporter permease [Microbacterium sp.]|uniref:FecCD family ABC transporter permease n=1 Tax=Microbacterium sp. TaxID=51671 RepID=UPI0039E46288
MTLSTARRSRRVTWAVLLAAVPVIAVLSLGIGTHPLSPAEVVGALADLPGHEAARRIVVGLRLPRVLIALTAGALLGVAGALLQTTLRNPLADPGLLGVSAGAVLAIVGATTILGVDRLPPPWPLVAATAGGIAAGSLVLGLGGGARRPVQMLLTGVVVSAVLSGIVSVLLLLDGALFSTVLRWVVGSLNGRVWEDWALLWPWALVTLSLALALRSAAAALWLGPDAAHGVGLRVKAAGSAVVVTAILLTAGAVNAVGAIGFIGLLGPHLARLLGAAHPRLLIPSAALTGALLLGAADLISASLTHLTALADIHNRAQLPAGAMTAVVGGPLLLILLLRGDRSR